MNRILVINNDNDTMSLLKTWLEKKSYMVTYTSSADEASILMQKFKPELLLVDVLQKEVISLIKKNSETAHVPIILMTGYSTPSQMKITADDFIEKPFDLKLLERKIEKLIPNDVIPITKVA